MLEESEQQSVICGLRVGNRSAWTALYNGYSVDIWRHVARLIGKDPVAIADVVQEVFLAAARSARNFDPALGSLWNWLTGIAQHHVAAYWKQAGQVSRLRSLCEAGAVEVSHLLEPPLSIAGTVDAIDMTDLVRSILSQIPADYAALLTAKYMDDQSLVQIAARSGDEGMSLDALKSKLARARREFRTRFEQLERVTGRGRGPRETAHEIARETAHETTPGDLKT